MDREAIGGNSPPVIVELTGEDAEFLKEFMAAQVSQTLLVMTMMNSQGKLKRETAEKMIDFNEKAKAIKTAVSKGIEGDL